MSKKRFYGVNYQRCGKSSVYQIMVWNKDDVENPVVVLFVDSKDGSIEVDIGKVVDEVDY